jgi:hypothetical protein
MKPEMPSQALPRPTEIAHQLLAGVVRPGARAVDATAGNGHDTVFLAGLVGESGRVLALDIQPEAVAATRARCDSAGLGGRVRMVHGGHEDWDSHLAAEGWEPGCVAAAVFNLGYLPGAGKSRITKPATTLVALERALAWLATDGLITVVCYPGHPGGAEEGEAVRGWAAGLAPKDYQSMSYGYLNQPSAPPFLVAVRGRRPGGAVPGS